MSEPTPAQPLPDGLVVLDASFVIALLDGETAAQRYAAVLPRSAITSVTLGEVFAKVHTATGVEPEQVQAGLLALGADLVDLPVAAAARFPALRTIDAARRAQQRAGGEKAAALPRRPGPRDDHQAAGAHRRPALDHPGPPRHDRGRPPLPRRASNHIKTLAPRAWAPTC